MTNHVPEGLHSITPYFTVDDADRLLSFVTTALDGQVIKEERQEDGRIRHARVRIGDSVIMVNEAGADYEANRSQMHLWVSNVDTVFATALSQGATAVTEPNQRPYGDRMAGFVDPCANLWWIASATTRRPNGLEAP